ncbi:binding-protein-dependent transport system inner membrane component [Streptomyces viridochromogenes DSM 40736]|uniref:Binding-protein-dependent transport system inner membrane component n=1 Tax=Streptomyces viridochromogenes (strain DSM 40736 / JCM 4977 / BCRC 1201 / Tue 494) TaxID=591159 RepID=D9X4T5_STRVT|nr:sugar ABC transporter permease [Streptomyces viridochromogenes]EFL29744.1 binding-protein-dependent transport system inner membrane component [Streptomyces viridochromogenes DSM 40736]
MTNTRIPAARAARSSAAPAQDAPRPSARDRGSRLLATLFLAPTIVGIVVFTVVPIVGSVVLSLFHWNVIDSPRYAGLSNYGEVFGDETVLVSFRNTLVFMVLAVALQLLVALALALTLNGRMPVWLRSVFRSAFFFPLVLSAASISVVMKYLFNQDFGVINWLLGFVGIAPVPWLTSQNAAMATVVLVYVWQQFGFSFLLFVGGLNNIPKEIHEAAALDGATGLRKHLTVTLPLLSPTLLVASVVGIINALQVFEQPYVLTNGGPGDSTRTVVMVIYERAFEQLRFGEASAVGVLLFVLIMAVTALQFRLSRRFVHYQ